MARVRLGVAERREELLRAAVAQIEERGVAAVRVADVASALGVSNALVLYHFSTKEQLVAAAFAHAAEADLARLRQLLGRRAPAVRRLRAAVRWYAPTGQAKGWRLWIEGWAASLRDPVLRRVAASLDREWKTALAVVIAEGAEAGEFRCADPDGAAWRLTAFLDGLAVQTTAYAGSLPRGTLLRWADEALDRELGLPGEPYADAMPGEPDADAILTEAEAATGVCAVTGTGAVTETATGTGAVTETATGAETETATVTDAEAATGAEAETDTTPWAATEAEAATGTGAVTETGPGLGRHGLGTGAALATGPSPDPGPEPDPGLGPGPGPNPARAPRP